MVTPLTSVLLAPSVSESAASQLAMPKMSAPTSSTAAASDLIYRRRLLLKPSKALQEAIKKVNIEIVPDDTVPQD